MSKNPRRIIVASCTFCAAVLVSNRVIAGGDGWSGTGSDNFGGGKYIGTACGYVDGSNYYRIDCTGVSWLKYEPTEIQKKEKHAVHLVPRGEGTKYGETAISEKCAGSEGFYHLGINFKAVHTVDDYFLNYTINGGKGGYVGNLNKNFINDSEELRKIYSPWGDNIGTYEFTYRLATANSWGHRYNLTESSAGNNFNTTVPGNSGATMVFGHQLYKNGVMLYESETAATPRQDIPKFYAAFLNNKCSGGTTGCSEQTDGCSYNGGSWDCKETPTNVFAFCAYPLDDPTSLSPKAKITISGHPKSPKSTSYNFSDSKSTDTVEDLNIYTVNTSTIKVRGDFNFKIDKSISTTSFTPTLTVGGESVKANSLSLSGVTEIGDGLGGDAKTKTVSLEANVPKKICVSAKSPSKISSTSTSGERTAEACLYVKYVPVTAEVDSDTIAVIDQSYLTGSKKKTIYYSHEDGAADYTKKYEDVGVKPGPMKVTWGHYLGYKNLSGVADGGVWSTTYNLQGGAVLGHKLKIDPYRNPGTTLANYKWQYYYNNGDGNGEYPSASNSHTKNIRNTGVFPGESSTISQTLKHPEKVNVVDGSKAANSSEEESKVEITLKGTDIECGLSKGEWGASEDHMMTIGVSNPRDYRWLAIQRTGSPKDKFPQATVVVGDGIDASKTGASLWLAPKDEFQILQKACFGSQIAIDAANKQSNRWTKNPWDKKTDNKNTKFTLVAPEKLKETRVFGNDSYRLNNAAWLKSTGEASLLASEIGISSFNDSQESTPTERINGNYQISTASKIVSIENFSNKSVVNRNLGERLETTFSKPNGEKVGITVNVPYNYYLDLKIVGDMDVITSADAKPKFTAEVQNKARKNMQVCSGALVSDPSKKPAVCNAYSTDTKPTTASMMVFTMDSDFSLDDLNGHANFLREGNATDKMSLELNLRGELGNFVGSIKDYKTQSSDNNKDFIQSGSKWELESSEINNLSDLPVGTKLCAAIAAYPSDSHNSEVTGDDLDAYAIDSSNQDGALVPTGQRTKISVQCRTVAKRQNMSVEGNGILTTGRVLSSEIMYGDKIFTSWSEYQITSGASSNAASGAATGYSPDKKLTGMDKNKAYFTKDDYSIADNSFLFPQSLGSMIKTDKPSAGDEANIAWNHTLNLKKDIINKYGGGDRCSAPEGADYNLSCFSRAEENVNSAMVAGLAGKPTAVIRNPDGTLRITENIAKPAGTKQLILIAKNIIINNNVSEINAWLIVDGGVFNTCNGYHINDPTDNGNNRLLTECHDWLYIKGPVIVDSASSPLELPRTFGGGSKLQDDKYVIDESSFIQRAEIFDFDPDMVRWAYEESIKDPQLSTTYVETLAPKL